MDQSEQNLTQQVQNISPQDQPVVNEQQQQVNYQKPSKLQGILVEKLCQSPYEFKKHPTISVQHSNGTMPSFMQKGSSQQKQLSSSFQTSNIYQQKLTQGDLSNNRFHGQESMKSESIRIGIADLPFLQESFEKKQTTQTQYQVKRQSASLMKIKQQNLTPLVQPRPRRSMFQECQSPIPPQLTQLQFHYKQQQQSPGIMSTQIRNKITTPKNQNLYSQRSGSFMANHLSDSVSESDQKILKLKQNKEVQNKVAKNYSKLLKEQRRKKKGLKEKRQSMDSRRSSLSIQRAGQLNLDKNNSSEVPSKIKRARGLTRSLSIFKTQKTSEKSQKSEDTSEGDIEDNFARIERNFERSSLTIFPDSNFRSVWDIISSLLIIHWCITLPLQAAFSSEVEFTYLKYFDIFAEIWFIIDIFLNFSTGYHVKGILIMKRKEIVLNYLKTWFFFDLIASVPYSIILFPIDNHYDNSEGFDPHYYDLQHTLNTLAYIKTVRVLRFIKLEKLMITYTQLNTHIVQNMTYIRITKLLIITFFVAHWMACLFYIVAHIQQDTAYKTWISNSGMQDADISEKYINALYWTITTMSTVGYGDIRPQTSPERSSAIFIMLIAAVIHAYIINEVGGMIKRINEHAQSYKQTREKMTYVNQYLASKQIPKDLIAEINRYLQYNWEMKKKIKIEEEEVMDLLNDDLKNSVTVHLNGRIIRNCELFDSFNLEFVSQLTFLLNKKRYSVGENIVVERDVGGEIFFIESGKVAVLHQSTHTYLLDLNKEDMFGEIGFFADAPRQCTIKSRDFTDLLTLKRECFLEAASDFPEVIEMFYRINARVSVIQKDYTQLNLKCYICGKRNHISIDCREFFKFKGNLRAYYKKYHTKSNKDKTHYKTEQDEEEELHSLASHFYKNELQVPRQSIEIFNGVLTKDKGSIKTTSKRIDKSTAPENEDGTFQRGSREQDGFYQRVENYYEMKAQNDIVIQDQEQKDQQINSNKGIDQDDQPQIVSMIQSSSNRNHYQQMNNNNVQYLSIQPQQNQQLEDIYEEAEYENDDQGFSKTPKPSKSSANLDNYIIVQRNASQDLILQEPHRVKQHISQNKLKVEEKNIGNIKSLSSDQEIQTELGFSSSQQEQEQDKPVMSSQNLADQGEIKIRPFHQFKTKIKRDYKKALQKKLKVKATKLFREDTLENLVSSAEEIQSPSLSQKGQQQFKNFVGMHTLISSKDSYDFTQQKSNNNNINNLLSKKQRMSERQKKTGKNSVNSSFKFMHQTKQSSTTVQQLNFGESCNQNIPSSIFNFKNDTLQQSKNSQITKQQENLYRQSIQNSYNKDLNQFVKINNISWAKNVGNTKPNIIIKDKCQSEK